MKPYCLLLALEVNFSPFSSCKEGTRDSQGGQCAE